MKSYSSQTPHGHPVCIWAFRALWCNYQNPLLGFLSEWLPLTWRNHRRQEIFLLACLCREWRANKSWFKILAIPNWSLSAFQTWEWEIPMLSWSLEQELGYISKDRWPLEVLPSPQTLEVLPIILSVIESYEVISLDCVLPLMDTVNVTYRVRTIAYRMYRTPVRYNSEMLTNTMSLDSWCCFSLTGKALC